MGEQKKLRFYNTLTRSKEVFEPIDPDNVRMYVCGPTVYDYAHIGNARPVIVFDVLYRLLRHVYGKEKVTYVRNITDVDDKINARALRDFPDRPLNEAIRAVTERTEAQFRQDVAALGCLEPDAQPRATDFVLPRDDGKTDMASLIQTLISRGHAYDAEGEILFDVSSMADYGRLSNRKLEDQQAGARIAVESHKKNPGDFVLWKASDDNEPGWDAHFDMPDGRSVSIRGRPGWHIECSAMSEALLWDAMKDRLSPQALARPHQFDIHGGGLDLIFPHHENEIAQSRCAHGTPAMANHWMHNGFLQVEGRKMAKSEGNFVTINDVLHEELPALVGLEHSGEDENIRRRWNGLSARFSMLQTHYREPVDWTRQRLLQASDELYRWYEILRDASFDDQRQTGAAKDVELALGDDLNTWAAFTALRAHAKRHDVRKLGEGMALLGLLDRFFLVNNDLLLFDRAAGVDEVFVEKRKNERLAFIREKNWTQADRIRDELLEQGIQLKDSKDPVTGERVTTWEVKR